MKAIRSVMKTTKEGKSSSSLKKKNEKKATSSKSATDPPGERVEYVRNADGKLVKRTTRMRKKASKKNAVAETSSVKTLSSGSMTVPSYIDEADCSETSIMSDFSSSHADKDPIIISEYPPGTATSRSKSLITPSAVKELNSSSHALLDNEIAKHKAVLARRMENKKTSSLQAPASPKRNFTIQKRSTSSVADVNPFETTNFGSGHFSSYSGHLGLNDAPPSPKNTFTRDSSTHSWVKREATQPNLLEADDDEDESFAGESMYSANEHTSVFSYNPPTRPMLLVEPTRESLKATQTTYKSSSVSAIRAKSSPSLRIRDSLKLSFIQQGDKGMLSFSNEAKEALDNCVDVEAIELPTFDTPHALLARPVFYNKICGPVVMIQAMIRGFLQYRRYEVMRDQMESMVTEWATTTVQAAARRWMAMARAQQIREQARAVVPLQAMVRRGLVRKNTRVPLLEFRLRNIKTQHKEELKAIEKLRRKDEKMIRKQLESKAQKKDNKESSSYEETQEEILHLKEENKILREENAQLMEDTKILAFQNRQAIETLEQTQAMIEQLQKDIPGLERDQEKLADVEKQFSDRLKQYKEAYVEGAELVAGEEGIKTTYWKSIVEICHHVKEESFSGKKKSNPELPLMLKAITQELLNRDATDDAWMDAI